MDQKTVSFARSWARHYIHRHHPQGLDESDVENMILRRLHYNKDKGERGQTAALASAVPAGTYYVRLVSHGLDPTAPLVTALHKVSVKAAVLPPAPAITGAHSEGRGAFPRGFHERERGWDMGEGWRSHLAVVLLEAVDGVLGPLLCESGDGRGEACKGSRDRDAGGDGAGA